MSLKKRLGRTVRGPARRKLMLFPLMDMFFILLLYFIVTAGMRPDLLSEEGIMYPTPVKLIGNSQIFIQIKNTDSLLWLDNTCFLSGWRTDFIGSNVIENSPTQLMDRFRQYYEELGKCAGSNILVTIRCPGNMDFKFIHILEKNLQNLFDIMIRNEGELDNDNQNPKRNLDFNLIEGMFQDISLQSVTRHESDSVEIKW
jgi:hypothetical protein